MEKEKLFRTTKYDFLLAGIILFVSVGALLPFKGGEPVKKKALIYRNNVLLREIDLPVSGTQCFDIEGPGEILVEAKNYSVRVAKISCPLRICEHQGWISSPSRAIVCLPNKLLIKIEGIPENNACDAVSH
jgi:hypothetical protein